MGCFDSQLKNTRRDLGITYIEAASACKADPPYYLAVERGEEDEKHPSRAAVFANLITQAHGIACPRCGSKVARLIQEEPKGRDAFLHCGCSSLPTS